MATNDDDAAASSAKDDNEVFFTYIRTYVRLIPLRARDLQKKAKICKEKDIALCSLRSNHKPHHL